jgi:hypothetical protein
MRLVRIRLYGAPKGLPVPGMSGRPVVAQLVSRGCWLAQLFIGLTCINVGCSRQSETAPQKDAPLRERKPLLADPLSPPTAAPAGSLPLPREFPTGGDSNSDQARAERCPRRLERAVQVDCEGSRTKQELTRIWSYWRMCADLSGVEFREGDEVQMRVAIRGGRGSVMTVKRSDGVPPAVVSCLSAAVRATDVRQPRACELDLFWSPLAATDCRSPEAK